MGCPKSFPIVTKLNKIKSKKNAKSFSTEVNKFCLQMKNSKIALVFQNYQSTGYQKVVEEDTSQEKLWLMPSNFSSQQNVILPSET